MSILIKNVLALLPEGAERCCIFIEGDSISEISLAPGNFAADKVIDGTGKLAIPGFVNAHAHSYMTLFRNMADDLDFQTWLFKRILPMEDSLSPEDGYRGAMLACVEMIKSGCTCFSDMHMFPGVTPRAATDAGMRAVVSRGLTGGAGDAEGGVRRLREAEEEFKAYKDSPSISFLLAPHAPYTCDEGYLREIVQKSRDLGIGLHTHLSESRAEVEQIKERYGCTPTEFFDRCGVLTSQTVAAHCVHLTQGDIRLLAERGVSVAVNSLSNLKLGNGIAPVPKLLEAGVNLCLGTDSAASNNSLSMLRELQFVTLLHKGVTEDPTCITARQGLKMATENGAKALGLGGITGRLEKGYKADIAIFDEADIFLTAESDPYAALCYSSSGISAETVIIGGRPVLENREFTTIDTEKIYFEAQEACKRLKTGGTDQ